MLHGRNWILKVVWMKKHLVVLNLDIFVYEVIAQIFLDLDWADNCELGLL